MDPIKSTIIAVDVGNTITRFGIFDAGVLRSTWNITTPIYMTSDEARLAIEGFLGALAGQAERAASGVVAVRPTDAIVSCVVPNLTEVWTLALQVTCGRRPLVVGPGLKTGIKMHYNDPSEVGADRVADLVAAKAEYGAPLIVVDMGTTTNFEILDKDGSFAGGIIAPGLVLAAKALAQAAARLPVIEVKAPLSIIGKSTREAMQSGVVMGEVARLDGLIELIWKELGYETRIVVTGSDAVAISALSRYELVADETLTLRGLGLLHEANRKK